jgi:flagellar operon protein
MYPNVTSLPSAGSQIPSERLIKRPEGSKTEFDQVLDKQLDLTQVREPLRFSAHATQRLSDRKIKLDQATMAKVSEAVDRAAAKGVEDTLVLSGDTALIVNVKNRTVITVLDKNGMNGNVFTNIDGAVVI